MGSKPERGDTQVWRGSWDMEYLENRGSQRRRQR